MGMITLIISILISVLTVAYLGPNIKKFLERIGILGIDQQKLKKPRMPTSGGLLVLTGLLLGCFFYIGANTFLYDGGLKISYILAAICSILIITLVGFLDDINMRAQPVSDKGVKEHRIGFKQWQKPLLTLPAAIPLMVVSAGVSQMTLPFFGLVDFGVIYPLILIPIAVVCVSNATNMLAGMNGLEAGMGFVATLALGIYAFVHQRPEACIIALATAFSLLTFLYWNKYPAKFLPGDSLTYLIGASIVSVVIIGNMERFGIIIFTPWILEAILKLRSRFKARSLGDLQKDGSLKPPYKKIYSLTHLVMKIRRFKEWQISLILILLEAVICGAALWVYL